MTPVAYSWESEGVLRNMDSDYGDGWIWHRFAPGEEPTVYTKIFALRWVTNTARG
jgi:hypothetical protein